MSADRLHPANPGVGINRYAYALGNPTNLTDRSGLETPICSDFEGDIAGCTMRLPSLDETLTVNGKAPGGLPYLGVLDIILDNLFSRREMSEKIRERVWVERPSKEPDVPATGCTGEGCEPPPQDPPDDPTRPPRFEFPTGTIGVNVFPTLVGINLLVTNGADGFGFCVEPGLGEGLGLTVSPENRRPQSGLRTSAALSLTSPLTGGGTVSAYGSRDILGTGEYTGGTTLTGQLPFSGEQANLDLTSFEYRQSFGLSLALVAYVSGGVCIGY